MSMSLGRILCSHEWYTLQTLAAVRSAAGCERPDDSLICRSQRPSEGLNRHGDPYGLSAVAYVKA